MAAPVIVAPPKLNKKKRLFVEGVVKLGDDLQALEYAGYSIANKGAKNKARKLRTELALHIEQEVQDYIKSTNRSIIALLVLDDLMESTSDQIKLKAAQDTLTRAGHDEDKVIKIEKTVTQMSAGAIDNRIAELLEKLQGEYIPAEIVDEG